MGKAARSTIPSTWTHVCARPCPPYAISRICHGLFVGLVLGAAFAGISRTAWAQGYPARPVTVIVPFAPGGASDVIARIVGEYLSRSLGQQFVIENVAGAGGTTGTTRTMRANPDGYTIGLGQMGTHAAAVALYPNLTYRPDSDFEPIGMIAGLPIVLTARKDFPPSDLHAFMLYLKANAGTVNVAHAGVGSITHVTCLMLHSLIGVQPTFVPFNGAAPAMNALLGGQVDYICNAIPDAVPHIAGRTAKGYAITTAQRSPALPGVPTSKEAGLPAIRCVGLERPVRAEGRTEARDRPPCRCARKRARRRERAQPPHPARLRDSRQIKARPASAGRPRHERDRALDPDHQGGKHQGGMINYAIRHSPCFTSPGKTCESARCC